MPQSQTKISEFQKQIQDIENKRQTTQNWEKDITSLSSFSSEDKIRIFDDLYDYVFQNMQTLTQGERLKDEYTYVFEKVMTSLLGNTVWEIRHSIPFC